MKRQGVLLSLSTFLTLLPLFTLSNFLNPKATFAQQQVDIEAEVEGKEELKSPTKKIKEPKIGPHKASPSGERRTTLVQIPEEEKGKPFVLEQRDFLLGVIVGTEIFLIIFLIYSLRRRKNPS